MRVFVTGSASCVGSVLLPILCADETISEVTGIDIKGTKFSHPKFKSEKMDVRDAKVAEKMSGHDAVIHLAFTVQRKKLSLKEAHDVNVNGGINVTDAAIKNGIQKFINLSSVSVYGAGDNIKEEDPANPSATFPYAQDKKEFELYLNDKLPSAVNFRAHLVQGANAKAFVKEMFSYPFYIKFKDSKKPRQQIVHEKDLAEAIMLALKKDASGTFNLAAPEIITYGDDYIKQPIKQGRKKMRIPFWLVRRLAPMMPYIDKRTEIHDLYTWIEMLDTNLNVNCDKARNVLGWVPKFTPNDARNDAMSSLRRK